MSLTICADDLVGKFLTRICTLEQSSQDGFRSIRCFVDVEGKLLEIDSRGIYEVEELTWSEIDETRLCNAFSELTKKKIVQVLASDYLPSFVLRLEDNLLLYCSDLGGPFDAFGPQYSQLGELYKIEDFLDYWQRSPLEIT